MNGGLLHKMGIREWLVEKLQGKQSGFFVELSIGRINIKDLNNGILNKCYAESCIAGELRNDAVFFEQVDYHLTNMRKKQIDNLSVKDGRLLRAATRGILMKHDVLSVEPEIKGQVVSEDITPEEVVKLQEMKGQVDKETEKWLEKRPHQ